MRTARFMAIVLAAFVALVTTSAAGDEKSVTVAGTIMCAKCLLEKSDAASCQDVLVAENKTEYYLVKNELADKHGHGCKVAKPAVVTGKVFEKDGKKWIEASKIEEPPKS